ncbi:MAG: zinc-dependent metalloprotease family protein [Candidatus Thiodiazotropha endolucinida]
MATVNLNVVFITINTAIGAVASGWSQTNLTSLINQTNRIWQQANIRFAVTHTSSRSVQMPGANTSAVINNAGFFFLQSQVAPAGRITVGLVNQVADSISAGMATIGGRFTLQPHRGISESYKPLALAHELGHILGLSHVTSNSMSARERLAATSNLMTPGIIRANPVLTGSQISSATTAAMRRRPPTKGGH